MLITSTNLIFAISALVLQAKAYMLNNNPNWHSETLDPSYELQWLVDRNLKRVTFNLTVQTTGFVAFGLSPNGDLSGADIFIGGVSPNGQPYFLDRHSDGTDSPEKDASQDWRLHSARETTTHTFLSFSRLFDTCDPDDYPITENKISVIWAYGEFDDDIEFQNAHRGTFNLYLLHPDYSPEITYESYTSSPTVSGGEEDLKVWTIRRIMELPPEDTTYWCTMHKAPVLPSKHHAIGFNARFSNDASQSHAHHLSMYKCVPPPGRDAKAMFNRFVNEPGQSCLIMTQPTGIMPTEYCTELFQEWGSGGRSFFLPPHVGQTFGVVEDEYYVIQVHYDNPQRLEDVVVDASVDIFYTSQLRENEGGFMIFRHTGPGLPPSLLIPPNTTSHNSYGICSSECTTKMFPENGINIVAAFLHSHNSGRGIRFQHFRKDEELPWIAADDTYDNQYQQIRVLSQETQVLPGDQLVVRCSYDNTWTNGTVLGGFSTRQEMCLVSFLYYNKIPDYNQCSSQIDSEHFRRYFLGVQEIERDLNDLEYTVVTPTRLAGLKITEVSDNHVNWDRALRRELQAFHLYHPHIGSCNKGLWNPGDFSGTTSHPFHVKSYVPPNECAAQQL